MTIRVALEHVTEYCYDKFVALGPQVIRLRPAPHCRTPVSAYSLVVEPSAHFLNWQQDPHGNFLARVVFHEKTKKFRVQVDLHAEMTVINPFDFFIEDYAELFPFTYDPELEKDLKPYLEKLPTTPLFEEYARTLDMSRRKTVSWIVDLNQKIQRDLSYLIRLEPGVQTPTETLEKRSGSCRDFAWLAVQLLRQFGLASRFVSGYLVQLVQDQKPLEGPTGPIADFTDLHAWAEVFLPGAGWVGLDSTSGLLTGEGHIPLAATPSPQTAAPISGAVDDCESEFDFHMKVTRIHEDPRVTKPYSETEWAAIDALGTQVDAFLNANQVRLTMGGEPTFVSIEDMESAEWNTEAVGHHKQKLSDQLIRRLRDRFAQGGLLHFGQGKWYPGESLPRWAYSCLWRKDGEPIWHNQDLLADVSQKGSDQFEQAAEFLGLFSERLLVDPQWIRPAHEDIWHIIELEQKLPINVDPREFDLTASEERRRLASLIEQGGIAHPRGYVLPLTRAWWQTNARWVSGPWPFRTERLFLIPGDSPIGLRLPMESLPVGGDQHLYSIDPFDGREPLPGYAEIRRIVQARRESISRESPDSVTGQQRDRPTSPIDRPSGSIQPGYSDNLIRTALCVEPRNGHIHLFLPPVGTLEDYLELVNTAEQTAEEMQTPVVIEGYLPPFDPRINLIKVTPDPGVIEVNIHPSKSWHELKEVTTSLYQEARQTRLGTEKFQLDGRHSGTGGGNHIVIGGATPAESPFLRRPDLLSSLIAYWNNHPSLSYVFSGLFIGPTSQAPRVDEGRRDALHELEIAMAQVPLPGDQGIPSWIVDRVFRNLLVDLTGNTHRAEICIDKLYSPDHATGRLGLVELRGFEMPPHERMSLAQQLLVRTLVARFWKEPFRDRLIHWETAIHDRFLLPKFLEDDLRLVLEDLESFGFRMELDWFRPHLEFRFPKIGEVAYQGISLELRQAIEPWYVLGEEAARAGTARYVDSSVERLQVLVQGIDVDRIQVACNGIALPLLAVNPSLNTGMGSCVRESWIAGVRYRAWQPPSCLHPLIPIHTPLIFDIVDRKEGRSLGGCRYHVDHPGGLNPRVYPVNALEAESRRGARFLPFGHTPGPFFARTVPQHPDFPMTLDLRRA